MRKSGFLTRAKLSFNFLFRKDRLNVKVLNCEQCGSMDIVKIPDTEDRQKVEASFTTCIWKQKYKCQKCGAKCDERQTWKW